MFSSFVERCLQTSPIGAVLVLLLAPLAPLHAASTLTSYAIVHDDGTLTIRKRRVRLHGIHIPSTPRSCSRVMRPARCGSRAANALDFKIQGFVECRPLYRHRDRSISAVCYNDGQDLGAYLIDRREVSNREYAEFVEAGGYQREEYWHHAFRDGDATLSFADAMGRFVDATGRAGPAGWRLSDYPDGAGELPVTGVSWYEAAAYARWVGMRLPGSAEWTKAGAWPVSTDGSRPNQRKYPWGDAMDRTQANLWGSGFEGTCSVYDFDHGASVGGIYQLIGNVWEWTADWYGRYGSDAPTDGIKVLRGGAMDAFAAASRAGYRYRLHPSYTSYNICSICYHVSRMKGTICSSNSLNNYSFLFIIRISWIPFE